MTRSHDHHRKFRYAAFTATVILFFTVQMESFAQLQTIHNARYQNKEVKGPLTASALMKEFYGKFDHDARLSFWTTNNAELKSLFGAASDKPSQLQTAVVSIDSVRNGTLRSLYVIFSTRPVHYDCGKCIVMLDVVKFEKKADSWRSQRQYQVAMVGNWGEVPPFEARIADTSLLYVFRPGGTRQGMTYESIEVYTEVNDTFQKVLGFQDAYLDNAGDCNEAADTCWGYDSVLSFGDPRSEMLPDINILTTGTYFSDEADAIKPLEREVSFMFDATGKRYLQK